MRILSGFLSFAVLLAGLGVSQPAFAQMPKWGAFGAQDEGPPEPPQDLPPLPEGAEQYADPLAPQQQDAQQQYAPPPANGADYYMQQQRRFPPLPPSRPCVMQDVIGQWKLLSVYEDPIGPETPNFSVNRYQYLIFEKSNIYAKYISPTVSLPPNMVRNTVQDDIQSGLHQFLVNETGIIYFYNQGIATDAQACFIVVNERGSFVPGEMILMPPKGQVRGRLAKVYIRYTNQKPLPGAGR